MLARQLLVRGKAEDAVVAARLGVATHPGSQWTQTALGEALLAAGDRTGALEAFKRSLAIFPNQYQLVYLLGFEEFGRTLDSIDGIWNRKAVEILDLARWLQNRGEFLSALTILQRLDREYPNDEDVLGRLAPGVGTPVTGGLTYREAHLLMENIADSGRLTSLEVVEINPIIDSGNMTAEVAVDLLLSALGKRIL